ncbi:hypothetical protein DV711_18030 [Motiliproteus coralliicola]|uniref:Uncharacterized protein n=1 Tax=Motiliproteus coralliicola TaxID=2283196 RepID=A0A369WEY6_9GAMM|nr:hypothetical protein [Motiliproteus coralliicola]RDE18025.1 hypothetical protein DV711_18030 [Motiliproteus coralliicola]
MPKQLQKTLKSQAGFSKGEIIVILFTLAVLTYTYVYLPSQEEKQQPAVEQQQTEQLESQKADDQPSGVSTY